MIVMCGMNVVNSTCTRLVAKKSLELDSHTTVMKSLASNARVGHV
jgi:hypothetical protein